MWVVTPPDTELKGFSNRHNIAAALIFMLSCFSFSANAEPWLDTHNAPLRADIEQLSRAGIIRVPINTWPLMWSGILNDLERRDSAPRALSQELQNSLARVLRAGQRATRVNQPQQSLSLSVANQSQLLRQFGDSSRDEAQISLSRNGMTEHLAYNLEISRTTVTLV